MELTLRSLPPSSTQSNRFVTNKTENQERLRRPGLNRESVLLCLGYRGGGVPVPVPPLLPLGAVPGVLGLAPDGLDPVPAPLLPVPIPELDSLAPTPPMPVAPTPVPVPTRS